MKKISDSHLYFVTYKNFKLENIGSNIITDGVFIIILYLFI
jgi:hypothetical protein